MILALLALALAPSPVQAPPPEVTASVDRTRLAVGEELVLTLRARTHSADPLDIMLPPLSGFAIVGSRELTEVSISGAGGPVRTGLRELRLRAEQAGPGVIGSVRVRQGRHVVHTNVITLVVDSAAVGAATLGPRARALLDAAAPPTVGDRVTVTVVVADDTVLVGQQLDVLGAAWFPRDLGARVGRPPVQLRTPEGVWAYPPTAQPGVVARRQVRGAWMDIYVAHQVVFPLAPGTVVVPPAAVEYVVPVKHAYLPRQDRYVLRTDSVPIVVMPAPGAPVGAGVAVGRGITLDVRVEPAETRVGEPIEVAATLTGVGNVPLWPEPTLRWPVGFRAYPTETVVRLQPRDGQVAGTKTFRYLVVPDSAGAAALPEMRYPYVDVATRARAWAASPRQAVVVGPGLEPRAPRGLPPLLGTRGGVSADRAARALGWGGWAAIVFVPPLVALVRRRRVARLSPPLATRSVEEVPNVLRRIEREFLAVLESHVPDAAARDGDGLAKALRAAGVESAVAEHVTRLRDRLRAARYGPRRVGDQAELSAEIAQVLQVLGAEPAGSGRRRQVWTTVLGVVVVLGGTGAGAQARSAEALYEAGALRAAADSFAARAEHAPGVAAHWYNLGAALYRAGADGKAIAAWTRAARLAPRDRVVRRARRLLPPPDAPSERLLAVGPATPGEWAMIAAAAWLALWAVMLTRRGTGRVALTTATVVVLATGGFAALEARRRALPVAVVTGPGTTVRAAPYGAASAVANVAAGAALLAGRGYGAWIEVRRPDGVRGWVLASEVVRL